MSRDLGLLLKEVLQLPVEARIALAESLLDSLDSEVDTEAEASWRQEIERRINEIDSKQASLIPWSEVRARLLTAQKNAQ